MDRQGQTGGGEWGELRNHPAHGSGSIDRELLAELVAKKNWSQRQAAEFFGVSESAVSKAMKRMKLAVSRDVAMRSAPKVLEAHLEGGDRLAKLVRQVEDLLGMLKLVIEGDQNDPAAVEARIKLRRLAGPKGNLGAIAVSLLGEARKQLEFLFNMQKEIYSLHNTEEFRAVVLEEIGKADPDVQRAIVTRMVQLNAFRSSLDFPDGGGNFGF
jgi:transcriptional regulator with XRE-family HTH domain